jgi:hypothetical protein
LFRESPREEERWEENMARIETIQVLFHLAQDKKHHQMLLVCDKDICMLKMLESTDETNLKIRSLRKQA